MPQSGGLPGPPRHAARLPRSSGLEGEEGRGTFFPCPRSGLLAWDARGRGGGRFYVWEEERILTGCLPTILGTNPRAGSLGSWAPPPNRNTLLEASSNPCMAVTERLPQREHSMDTREKPHAPHRCFVSGSSVFWSRPSSSPPRRTPSLRQEQQREGEQETVE